MSEFQFDQPQYEDSQPNKLRLPAIFLIVAESLALLAGLVHGLGQTVNILRGLDQVMPEYIRANHMETGFIFGVYASLALDILAIIVAPIVIMGAAKMLQRRSFGFARASAILSIVPLVGCCCCLLPVGFGIWALVVLNKPDVRAQFQS